MTLNGSPPESYGLFVLLPKALDETLERWTGQTPGATWPAWGGHITLINSFQPIISRTNIEMVLRRSCERLHPFEVQLDKVVLRDHLTRSGCQTVLLVEQEQAERQTALHDLRSALLRQIEQFKQDGETTRRLERSRYHPHISLTLGLPPEKAETLYHAAVAARLSARLRVSAVTLITFDEGQNPLSKTAFPFGP